MEWSLQHILLNIIYVSVENAISIEILQAFTIIGRLEVVRLEIFKKKLKLGSKWIFYSNYQKLIELCI